MENSKQETLEEAKERYLDSPTPHSYRLAVEFGAKWQQEKDLSMVQSYLSANLENIELLKRSYSEEEVILLLQKALTHKDDGEIGSLITAQGQIRTANFFSWFYKFKNK